MKTLIIFAVFALAYNAQTSFAQEKLKIEILYESLCPDSLRFITQQLHPTWPKIAAYSNILFVPFGKSESFNNGELFICQHGAEECAGNRVQSCALTRIPDQTAQVDFVSCFMTDVNSRGNGQTCVEAAGVSWEEVTACYESEEGKQLQLAAEEETKKYSPSFVPTIVYNDVFDQNAQDESIANFQQYVCSRLQESFPDACA